MPFSFEKTEEGIVIVKPLEFIDNNQVGQADLMAKGVSLIASSKISKDLVCISKTGEGVKFLARYINKDFYNRYLFLKEKLDRGKKWHLIST